MSPANLGIFLIYNNKGSLHQIGSHKKYRLITPKKHNFQTNHQAFVLPGTPYKYPLYRVHFSLGTVFL